MMKDNKIAFEPYTSLNISSLKEAGSLLGDILSSTNVLKSRTVNKPVVLYGAGSLGKMAKNFFDYLNMPFLYVVDKNAAQSKLDMNWSGVDIIRPDQVNDIDKKNCLLVICLVTSPLIEVRDDLKAAGWQDIAFFYDVCETYRDSYPLNNGWFLGNLGDKEIDAVEKVFNALDSASRMHYLQFLAWRKLRVELLSDSVQINLHNRFFIPEITDILTGTECFVDCGAHQGSVTELFLKTVHNRYKAIYAIEPDDESYAVLKAKLNDVGNITKRRVAVGDKIGKDNFRQGLDFASKLDSQGEVQVDVVTLDSLNIPATFIKLHLEGGELNALRGAVSTIRKYRPIIAVTGYHNSDGAWKIPLHLIESTDNYRFHLRLHSWGGTGVVFYAVPGERCEKG